MYGHFFLSLSAHCPPELIHCLHTCLDQFSDHLLEKDPLLDLDARDTGLMPTELTVREELFEIGRLSLENLRGDDGVMLKALPLGLEDRPLPCSRGLWGLRSPLGVPLDGALPDLEP